MFMEATYQNVPIDRRVTGWIHQPNLGLLFKTGEALHFGSFLPIPSLVNAGLNWACAWGQPKHSYCTLEFSEQQTLHMHKHTNCSFS